MEAVASQHLRLSAVYWGLCCLELLDAPAETLDRSALRAWTLSCQPSGPAGGGFAPAPGHDVHLLSTLSGIQVLALLRDRLLVEPQHAPWRATTAAYVAALQQRDGSFAGDAGLALLQRYSVFSFPVLGDADAWDTGFQWIVTDL
jgi:geranylgeranyl transferase type-2 subunit beta